MRGDDVQFDISDNLLRHALAVDGSEVFIFGWQVCKNEIEVSDDIPC